MSKNKETILKVILTLLIIIQFVHSIIMPQIIIFYTFFNTILILAVITKRLKSESN